MEVRTSWGTVAKARLEALLFIHYSVAQCSAKETLTDGHQLYVLLVQELQRHRHVLQLHLAEGGPLVVLSEHLLLGQHLQEPDEPKPVAQVCLQVADPLVDAFQVLVTPAGECVLLDLFPRRVFGQVLLRSGHFCVLVRGGSVWSGRGALVEPGV